MQFRKAAILISAAMAVLAATPALACSIGRKTPNEIHTAQVRALREADLVFVARVANHGWADGSEFNAVYYQPLGLVSGDGPLPEGLSVAVFYCLPLPSIGETHVILMRSGDLQDASDRFSPVLGYYEVSDIYDSGLRERAERALRRAHIE